MKILAISLADSTRRARITLQSEKINAELVFVDAIPGNSISKELRHQVLDKEGIFNRHKRELLDNEFACFLSHKRAWREICDSKQPGIIVEDDAVFTAEFNKALEVLGLYTSVDIDIVLLGHSKLCESKAKYHYFKNPIQSIKLATNFSIGKPFKYWTSGMVGYYITPTGAKKLLQLNFKIRSVSDDWSFHVAHGLKVFEIRPYVIFEDFQNLPSSMEAERRQIANYRGQISNALLEPFRILRAVFRHAISRM
ncbi:glycosyltransferase family 25 protein [Hydrogenophaga sp.]|uniref:glycosyltransferase family 25 protein n=1 Tax=Hydrogenophaga sp. TaxID=1904254 RepID=UPI003F6BB6F9